MRACACTVQVSIGTNHTYEDGNSVQATEATSVLYGVHRETISELSMIGVICQKKQRSIVDEFFELFKVPWELYIDTKQYDVVLITGGADAIPLAKLIFVFGSERKSCDLGPVTRLTATSETIILEHKSSIIPIYGKLACFERYHEPILTVTGTAEIVGVGYASQAQRIVRLGYDLFEEVQYLLEKGQPVNQAIIPTVDIHIGLLREWIVDAGICLVEIPPVPSGYGFIACLTHDVDFVNIRDHELLDRSVLGFIARSLFPNNLRNTRSEIVWSRILRNWRALLSLPAVYLGLSRDIWFDIDRYMDLERGLGSTFYFIPLKGHAGESRDRTEPHWRAASYDVKEYQALVNELKRERAEIGVHGIDAWQDTNLAAREGSILRSLCGEESIGIRMHWLYFSQESAKMLEEAGFDYDSTIGYNEANGFRSGTTQVFCLPGSSKLLELPLNVMDTALFYSKRMGLSEAEAMEQCKKLITTLRSYGGVLTINWHTRSLSPERNWDSFYLELLDLLKMERVWFATAKAAVAWFRKRRQIRFEDMAVTPRGVKIKLRATKAPDLPGFTLRVHHPAKTVKMSDRGQPSLGSHWIDAPLITGESDIEVTV